METTPLTQHDGDVLPMHSLLSTRLSGASRREEQMAAPLPGAIDGESGHPGPSPHCYESTLIQRATETQTCVALQGLPLLSGNHTHTQAMRFKKRSSLCAVHVGA